MFNVQLFLPRFPAGNIRLQTNLAAGMYTVFVKGKDIDASEQIVVTGK
jgi:hypothetical protein